MADSDRDSRVRLAAFAFLARETELHGEVLSREILANGFTFDVTRVPLIGPQGIFKPSVLPEMPLSITTAPVVEGQPRPYEDRIEEGGLSSTAIAAPIPVTAIFLPRQEVERPAREFLEWHADVVFRG